MKSLSKKKKEKLAKIFKVLLWTVVPYALIKVPQELLQLPEFAQYSFLLNLAIYAGKTLMEK